MRVPSIAVGVFGVLLGGLVAEESKAANETYRITLNVWTKARSLLDDGKTSSEKHVFTHVVSFRNEKILVSGDHVAATGDFKGTTHTGSETKCINDSNVKYCNQVKSRGESYEISQEMNIGDSYRTAASFAITPGSGNCKLSGVAYKVFSSEYTRYDSGVTSARCRPL